MIGLYLVCVVLASRGYGQIDLSFRPKEAEGRGRSPKVWGGDQP